jgi:hypothetical protein
MKTFKNASGGGFEIIADSKTRKSTSIINLIGLIISSLQEGVAVSIDIGKEILATKGIKLVETGAGNNYKIQILEGTKLLKEFVGTDARIDALRYFANTLQKATMKSILISGDYQIKMNVEAGSGQTDGTSGSGSTNSGSSSTGGGTVTPTPIVTHPTNAEVQQMIQNKTDEMVLNPEKESMIGNAKVVNSTSYQIQKSDTFLVIGTPTENVSNALFLPNLNENQQIDLTLVIENVQGTTISSSNGSDFYEGENSTQTSTKNLVKGTYRIFSLFYAASTRHYVFDLKGAKGDKGTKGDKGEKGDVGDSVKIIRQNYTIQPGDKRIVAYHAENVLVITVPQNVQQAQFEVYNGSANPLSVVLEGQSDPLASYTCQPKAGS